MKCNGLKRVRTQAFAGGMGLSDRLKTLNNLWEAAER